MAMKRATKAQQEARQRAALRHRVLDMIRGANGDYALPDIGEDGGGLGAQMGLEAFGRFLGAIRYAWNMSSTRENGAGKIQDFRFNPGNLESFDSVGSIVEMLWECGVRAEMEREW